MSVGTGNVYKVVPQPNRDPAVSRPWQILVLLTVVITPLLCPTSDFRYAIDITFRRVLFGIAFVSSNKHVLGQHRREPLYRVREPHDVDLGHHGRTQMPPRSQLADRGGFALWDAVWISPSDMELVSSYNTFLRFRSVDARRTRSIDLRPVVSRRIAHTIRSRQ